MPRARMCIACRILQCIHKATQACMQPKSWMNTKCGAWLEIEWPVVLVLVVEGYLFGPLIISFIIGLGYLKAVSTCCWLTVSTSEVTTVQMSSVLTILLYWKNNKMCNNWSLITRVLYNIAMQSMMQRLLGYPTKTFKNYFSGENFKWLLCSVNNHIFYYVCIQSSLA